MKRTVRKGTESSQSDLDVDSDSDNYKIALGSDSNLFKISKIYSLCLSYFVLIGYEETPCPWSHIEERVYSGLAYSFR